MKFLERVPEELREYVMAVVSDDVFESWEKGLVLADLITDTSLLGNIITHLEGMINLTDVPLIRCVVLGDNDRKEMLRRYADLSGLPYDSELCEVVTAFNGQKCQFVDAARQAENVTHSEIHVMLLCVSVAREASVEDTVRMVLNTVTSIGNIPFVLVGTQIDKRTKVLKDGADRSVLPMSLSQAESFAKRIGASKYLECSAATGEGLDEVFEDAFEVGRKFAVEQFRIVQRKKSMLEEPNQRKASCIQQ